MALLSRGQKNALKWVFVLVLVAQPLSVMAQVMGYQNALGAFWIQTFTPGATTGGKQVSIEGEELSRFTGVLCKEDAAATLITSESIYIWMDWNKDGSMQRSQFEGFVDGVLLGGEIEEMSTDGTTAAFTSPSEYPIGRTIYLMADTGKDSGGRTYQIGYKKFAMSGHAASDRSALPIGNFYLRATDDGSISYSGLVGGVAIDDATDYNYTTNGAIAEFELRIKFATSDAGVLSQTHPDFYTGAGSFKHWGNGKDYAPSFVGMYMTTQDFIDLGIDTTVFDYVYQGASNVYLAKFLDDYDSDARLFYDSDDTVAPTFTFSAPVSMTAAGAITYIGIYQDVEWANFKIGIWGDTTDNQILGTLGNDWDWVTLV